MTAALNPAIFIRTQVFRCASQQDFAALLNTTQASVSRWEAAGHIPRPKQEAVRTAARTRHLSWEDSWFFEVPQETAPRAEVA